ncbi:hypothetical protein K1T71_014024 [Dendrolimus kikuchii]|uniref:Uncharacterized protein n=1 Tax=Dendrolimus kikuchii TaxID=765133 RepID=A0ACC1CGK5_9NEOP|nr:hypothetical protein K1T71_014024 [Dendrolimus kikuchii]
MYRLFVLLFFVSYAAAFLRYQPSPYSQNVVLNNFQRYSPNRYDSYDYGGFFPNYDYHDEEYSPNHDQKFDEIVAKLVDIERKVLGSCNRNIVERYANDNYRFELKLESYDVKSIVVKTKFRALFIKAEKIGTREEYREVRVLPRIVDVKNGGWQYDEDILIIRFPFKDVNIGCDILNENEEAIIPMKEEDFGIDIRIGEERWQHDENKFDYIVNKVTGTDRISLEYCNADTVERYDKDLYTIVLKLDDYDVNSIVVKAKYRAIYIKAEKNGTREEYHEIRVLPSVVNIKEGGWEYSDSMLKIRFSHRSDDKGCSMVNEEEVIIPMKEEYSGIDVRFVELETEETKTESPKQIEENIINERAQ